jgi:cell division protein ZapE
VVISQRNPELDSADLLASFKPPPRFWDVRFQTYLPDAQHPSQAAALAAVDTFARHVDSRRSGRKRRFLRAQPPESRAGIYLDGGFGVGKTHLLAALWHEAPVPKAYGTFVEYTNLVGALGFRACLEALGSCRLVCIDEFELDDPGDTVLISTLLAGLVEQGVCLAATSNTLPDRLGEGRFAADDFLREIQGLRANFEVLRIEGEDFRHRGPPKAPPSASDEEFEAELVRAVAQYGSSHVSCDNQPKLLDHLSRVHPSRFGKLVTGLRKVFISGLSPLNDQAAALRLVVLVDRLYDQDIPVCTTGVRVDQLFTPEMMAGGYRKKYSRAISRLVALANEGLCD